MTLFTFIRLLRCPHIEEKPFISYPKDLLSVEQKLVLLIYDGNVLLGRLFQQNDMALKV